jgi:O-antigen chain-terminating methyltransferase
MLIRNNPNIDFDALEKEINSRITSYEQTLQQDKLPEYDAEKLQRARLDMRALQSINIEGGLHQLYALEDADFAYFAYNFLLGRPPTEREAAACTGRLRAGENKTRIACELRYSEEGKDHNQNVNLRKEFIAYKLISLPVIGKLIDIFTIIISLPALKRLSQAKENHQYRMTKLMEAEASQKSLLISEMGNRLRALERELNMLKPALDEAQKAVASSRARLSLLEQKQSSDIGTKGIPLSANAPVTISAHADDSLYVAFEEKFRGSSSSVRDRMGYYLPLINKILESDSAPVSRKIVDIGCGRGEWLNLLKENGFEAIGIDTNVHNINSCTEAGLTALHEDALHWLARQADSSLGCISAFHVIEHLEFNQLSHFLDNALRCLCPGGLILLETPNPENLLIASNAFYLDPTHIRPLPPGLMEFLLSYKGFQEVSVDRMHHVDADLMIHEDTEVARRCNTFFYEAQDYAISGIKP